MTNEEMEKEIQVHVKWHKRIPGWGLELCRTCFLFKKLRKAKYETILEAARTTREYESLMLFERSNPDEMPLKDKIEMTQRIRRQHRKEIADTLCKLAEEKYGS